MIHGYINILLKDLQNEWHSEQEEDTHKTHSPKGNKFPNLMHDEEQDPVFNGSFGLMCKHQTS